MQRQNVPANRPTRTSAMRASITDEKKRQEKAAKEESENITGRSSRRTASQSVNQHNTSTTGSQKHTSQSEQSIHKKQPSLSDNSQNVPQQPSTSDNLDFECLKKKHATTLNQTKDSVASQGARPKISPGSTTKVKVQSVDHHSTRRTKNRDNLDFYRNKIHSKPYPGHKIEEMLKWKGDYWALECNHRYIQWLFPIPEGSGLNPCAQALLDDEAEEMRNDDAVRKRVLEAYTMMLDFYGLKLIDQVEGRVKRSNKWQERFEHLNRSSHNRMRITRILKSIGELGYERFQARLVDFLMTEATEGALPSLNGYCMDHWIAAVKDPAEQSVLYKRFKGLPVPPLEPEGPMLSEDEEDESFLQPSGKGSEKEQKEKEDQTRMLKAADTAVLKETGRSPDSVFTESKTVKGDQGGNIHKTDTVDIEAAALKQKAQNDYSNDKSKTDSKTSGTRERVSSPCSKDVQDKSVRKTPKMVTGYSDEEESYQAADGPSVHVPSIEVESDWNCQEEKLEEKTNSLASVTCKHRAENTDPKKSVRSGTVNVKKESKKTKLQESQRRDHSSVHCDENYHGNVEGLNIESEETKSPNRNLLFYQNEIHSSPSPGYIIDTMLKQKGNHEFFDEYPFFIQWLFPTREHSTFNTESQPLYDNEIQAIRDDPELNRRVVEAYRTVLDYFGMSLEDDIEGRIKPIPETFEKRWKFININRARSYRIFTRILTSLGLFGFERFQIHLIEFLITYGVEKDMLPTLSGQDIMHWLQAVTDEEERKSMFEKYQKLASRSPRETRRGCEKFNSVS